MLAAFFAAGAGVKQNFAGAWLTYRPEKGQAVDFYYLYLDNQNTVVQQGIVRAPDQVHTLGTTSPICRTSRWRV